MWIIKSKVLRRLRIEQLMSVENLARRSGVSVRSIRTYEARDTTARLDTMQCLAKALGAEALALGRVHVPSTDTEKSVALTSPNGPRAAPNEAAAATTATTKLPPPSRLEELVELERSLAPLPKLKTARGAVDPLTARRFQDIFTAYAMYEGDRFYLAGLVNAQRGITDTEASLLGSESGVGARFHVVKEVATGHVVGITVHTKDGAHTKRMQARLGERATVVLSVVRAATADACSETMAAREASPRGFSFFMSERPRPWGLVVEDVVDA